MHMHASEHSLTPDDEQHRRGNLGVGVDLTLVPAAVPGLGVADVQRPLVRVGGMQHLGEHARHVTAPLRPKEG